MEATEANSDWRPIADGNGVLLDHAQDLDDAPVLEPRLVVDEATQLRSERRHRSLRVVPGVEPVLMDAPNASVRAQRRDRCQRCDTTKTPEVNTQAAKGNVTPSPPDPNLAAIISAGQRD